MAVGFVTRLGRLPIIFHRAPAGPQEILSDMVLVFLQECDFLSLREFRSKSDFHPENEFHTRRSHSVTIFSSDSFILSFFL
jgi:hypothetical protein